MSQLTKQHAGGSRGIRRWMLAAGGFVAGMFLAFACSPTSRKRSGRLAKKLGTELRRLRDVILGRNRSAIHRALGPPRTMVMSVADQLRPEVRIEDAETWYYPLDAERAMAIRFVKDTARRVDFLSTPH